MTAGTAGARPPPRVAVVGGGMAGLGCATELALRGCHPVVFESGARLGGRCSSRSTRVGVFDDGAQSISGAGQMAAQAAHAAQRPGELPSLHPWTVPATPADDDRWARPVRKWGSSAGTNINTDSDSDSDTDSDEAPTLHLVGDVGVPSMAALADALARPLDVRLNTPVLQARRLGKCWALTTAQGDVNEDFQALVLAVPAPLAAPLAAESPALASALGAVRYSSRWVLLLGTERPVGLPGNRTFQGSPIERVAAMHSKPGRLATGPQRWFIEADAQWSLQHAHTDAETVADLLLDIFRAHAGRSVLPQHMQALQWQHAYVETPAATPRRTECLWDAALRLGVCGDSVVASRVDLVHRSGIDLARTVADTVRRDGPLRSLFTPRHDLGQLLEPQL